MVRKLVTGIVLLAATVPDPGAAQSRRAQPSAQRGADRLEVIERVTVIDGTGRAPLRDAVVVVEGGTIRAVGRRGDVDIPAGARRVDGGGGYLLPGFIDMHAHVALGPVKMDLSSGAPALSLEPDPEGSRRSLVLLLASGITTARDPGGPAARTVALRDSVARGDLVGPRLLVAGDVIDRTDFAGLTARVSTPDDVRREVRRQVAAGVDLVKLYAWLTPDLVAAGVDEAHRHGRKAVAHVMFTTWTEAAALGLDGIVHIVGWSPKLLPEAARPKYAAMMGGTQFLYGWLELMELDGPEMTEAIDALAAHGVTMDPTLVVFERAVRGDDPAVVRSEALAWASPLLVENWRTAFTFNVGWSPSDFERARAAWPKALALTKRLHERGVLLTAGTDANNPWTVPGESFHRELELLVASGISPAEVLVIATRNGARVLGLEREIGTIEVGKRADLVLLRDDPLRSIGATRSIEWVMRGGVRHRPADLLAPWAP